MVYRSRRGESLVELIVALVVLEVLGASALAAALTVERLNRRATAASADDTERWRSYRAAETQVDCVASTDPDTVTLFFPATTNRPAFEALLRCGR